ncbi:SAM-dependent methyltransferase [Sphingomonas sp. CJ20]
MTRLHLSLAALLRPANADPAPAAPRPGPSDALIAKRLADWRHRGHRAVRILDLDCGDGARLLRAAACARALGFVSIEGRGVSASAAQVRRARTAAAAETHPSTSLVFEIGEAIGALAGEHDDAADFVLLSQPLPYACSPLGAALARVCAGSVLASA